MSRSAATGNRLLARQFSGIIWYFLPIALSGYYALSLAPQRYRNLWLVVTGYLFYGWAGPWFMGLMFATTSIDWLVSLIIAHDEWRVWRFWRKPVQALVRGGPRTVVQRTALTISISLNLLVLGFFKYFNFGLESYNALIQSLGITQMQWHTALQVVLPLGISFYTFQALSYTIDVFRGDAEAG
jgi:alginate O-acetyltransferase complex protein AlgI